MMLPVLVVLRPPQQRDTPEGRQAHQRVDDTAEHTAGAAEQGGHDVKAEDADAAPVETTDDGQRQGDLLHDHSYASFSWMWGSGFSLPAEQAGIQDKI